ncbi:hypothetical protein [Clostridium paridis]|uniref:DUF4363 family protein n=1 Tax=Clostridium paridis TaxID=2803863 RepID=A0A937FH10_9CLOT|nr:hypothetical protein [Clostridium paridis]MBL4933229.1 hypothetical protein [Clostridium paridis]
MNKRIINGLILVCLLLVLINLFQFYRVNTYKRIEKSNTQKFQEDFNILDKSFDLYNSSSTLSNESAIKNSVSIVGELDSLRSLSSYKENKSISEMLLYLSQFFVLNSNQYVTENINKIRPKLKEISKNLNDENTIKEFNKELRKMRVQK